MDLVFPKPGNEEAFVKMAERLGIEELVFCYPLLDSKSFNDAKERLEEPSLTSNVKLSVGQIVTQKTRKVFPVLKVMTEPDNPRAAFEQSKADVVCNLELQRKPDFLHHRASGFNQIIAAIAAKRGIKLGINFANLLNAKNETERGMLMGRIKQNLKLAKKAGVEVIVISGAVDEWGLRHNKDYLVHEG